MLTGYICALTHSCLVPRNYTHQEEFIVPQKGHPFPTFPDNLAHQIE
jgi:hypothetical protein